MDLKSLPELSSLSFISPEQLTPPAGLPTGVDVLDRFLLWKGVPLGELSLFQGLPGTGASSLWLRCVQLVHQSKKWAAWVNSDNQLLPAHLNQNQIDLKKLLIVQEPRAVGKLFWMLQELISSSLFEVIGCQLANMSLKNHQLQKLKRLCRLHRVALIFILQKISSFINPLFALSIQFKRDFIRIDRALHRPTPFLFSGEWIHAHTLSQLSKSARKLIS